MHVKLRRACATALCVASSPTGADAQAGECYDAEYGPWRPVPSEVEVRSMPFPSESGDSLVYSFPPRVRLDAGGTIAVPDGALPTMHSRTRWTLVDSVMEFSLSMDGYAGLHGQMVPRGQGWSGTARTTSHIIGLQRYQQRVDLSRVDCDSPPPVPASADVDLPLEVRVDGRGTFAIGHTTEDSRRRIPLAPAEALGVYEGAQELLISRADDGTIEVIEIHFGEGGAQKVMQRLAALFGSREGSFKLWSNRSGSIMGPAEGNIIMIR